MQYMQEREEGLETEKMEVDKPRVSIFDEEFDNLEWGMFKQLGTSQRPEWFRGRRREEGDMAGVTIYPGRDATVIVRDRGKQPEEEGKKYRLTIF